MNNSKSNQILEVWDKSIITKPNFNDLKKLDIDDLIASIFCPGPFYWYIIDFSQRKMDFVHPNVKSILGIMPEAFTLEYLIDIVHEEDLKYMSTYEDMVIKFMTEKITPEDYFNYKMSYKLRARHVDGTYKYILHQAITLTTDRDNRVLQVLGIHCDIGHISTTLEREVSFIGINGRPSFLGISVDKNIENLTTSQTLFTKREIEIIQNVSEGSSTKEIAKNLHISIGTVQTHRKNILKKSNRKNMAEVITMAVKKGLI